MSLAPYLESHLLVTARLMIRQGLAVSKILEDNSMVLVRRDSGEYKNRMKGNVTFLHEYETDGQAFVVFDR